ncbi:hypothetical protein Hdeb2414_s0006g00222761 [Helianthus debilis subsp. tardiflorus]
MKVRPCFTIVPTVVTTSQIIHEGPMYQSAPPLSLITIHPPNFPPCGFFLFIETDIAFLQHYIFLFYNIGQKCSGAFLGYIFWFVLTIFILNCLSV